MTLARSFCSALLVALAILIPCIRNAQGQNFEWLRQQGTGADDFSYGASADGLGNIYTSGATNGNLGGIHFGAVDAFVSKHDANGTLLWTRQLGTSGNDRSFGVSADGSEHAYVAGATTGLLGDAHAGGNDAFLSKYDDSGAHQWTEQFGTGSNDAATSVSSDGADIFVAGITEGILGDASAGGADAFLTKYDAGGETLWTTQFGTTNRDLATSVSADGLGNVYVSGLTEGVLGLANAGGEDAFLSKYDSSGSLQWTRQFGTSADDVSRGVAADQLGNVFVVGVTANPNSDAWVQKYDSIGNLQWSREVPWSGSSEGRGVSTDGFGNVFITGSLYDAVNPSLSDGFVSAYDSDGMLLWTERIDISAEDLWHEVSANRFGDVFVSGSSGVVDRDVFVAKYSTVPEPATLVLVSSLLFAAIAMRNRVRPLHSSCHLSALLVIALSVGTFVDPVLAKKADGPGGGKPGGGNDGELELILLSPVDAHGAARAINDAGVVVGGMNGVAGVWNTRDETPAFSPLAGGTGVALDVNANGEIVGSAPDGPRYWAAMEAQPFDLPLPTGFTNGQAWGVSGDGIVVGEVDGPAQGTAAAAWRVTAGSVFGPVLLSPNGSIAYDIASLATEVNRVVGEATDSNGVPVATAWDLVVEPGGTFSVGETTTLIFDKQSQARAITESGDITGILADGATGRDLDLPDTAFVIRDGSLQILPSGKRSQYAIGRDLNDSDVVGATSLVSGPSNPRDAARWGSNNKLEDLTNYFGESWPHTEAWGINSTGDIVGFGSTVDDATPRAWLLRHPSGSQVNAMTVPEPSAIPLFVIGIALLKMHIHGMRRSLVLH